MTSVLLHTAERPGIHPAVRGEAQQAGAALKAVGGGWPW